VPITKPLRIETDRFRRFTHHEVVARDKLNLDIIWLKDDSESDAADLPDPDTLIAEIVEELTAAAAELAAAASPATQSTTLDPDYDIAR